MKKFFIIIIALLLIVATVFVHQRNESNENAEMERFAKIIADETDEDFEKATTDIIEKIKTDDLFISWVNDDNLPSDDSILSYFDSNYFKEDLYKFYNRTLTVCDPTTIILWHMTGR